MSVTDNQDHLRRLRRLVLHPSESDRDALGTRVELLMDSIPRPCSEVDAFIRVENADRTISAGNPARTEEDVLRNAAGAFDRQIRWHSNGSAHNVNQPVLLASAAVHAVTSLYNPNTLWDLVSGSFLDYEREVVSHLASLVGWTGAQVDGAATFGGKAGLLYAMKCGVNRVFPKASESGLPQPGPVVLTSDETHYSVDSAAALLGLGTAAVIRIPTDDGAVDPEHLRQTIRNIRSGGRRIAAVILSGGSTLDGSVDPMDACLSVIEAETGADRPWVHADLALGWPWLYFLDYDLDTNPLRFAPDATVAIDAVAERLRGIGRVDSFGVDLHKLGFAPYASAFFVTRSWQDLRGVFGAIADEKEREYGENFVQHHTIEHSRPGSGILAAWTALQLVGTDGFRSYLAHMHEMTAYLRRQSLSLGYTVCNPNSPSLATLMVPRLPLGASTTRNREDAWTEHVFREATGLNEQTKATLAIGYVPRYGRSGDRAALRLYLTNPHLNREAIDTLLRELEELVRHAGRSFMDQNQRFLHTPK